MMLGRRLAVGRRLAPIALAIGCASPTLPLPPPQAPAQEQLDADHVTLVAGCDAAEPYATITVINLNAPPDLAVTGGVVDGCGAWSDRIVYAHAGDYLKIMQELGSTGSLPTTVRIR